MHRRMAKEFGRIETNYLKTDTVSENLSAYGKKRKPLTTDKKSMSFSRTLNM